MTWGRIAALAVSVGLLAVPAHATAARACSIDDLRLAIGPPVSEKTEQHTVQFSLENASGARCTLKGYPVLTLFDKNKRRLAFAYGHRGDQMVTGRPPETVSLAPGRSAYFAFNKNVCVGFSNRLALSMRLTLPNARRTRSIRIPRSYFINYCPAGDPGHGIAVSPFEPRRAACFCQAQGPCGSRDKRRL